MLWLDPNLRIKIRIYTNLTQDGDTGMYPNYLHNERKAGHLKESETSWIFFHKNSFFENEALLLCKTHVYDLQGMHFKICIPLTTCFTGWPLPARGLNELNSICMRVNSGTDLLFFGRAAHICIRNKVFVPERYLSIKIATPLLVLSDN